MTADQEQEVIVLLRGLLGALGNIGDQLERIAGSLEKKPPSSKRGKS